MPELDRYFELMLDKGASDLHLSVGYPPMLRLRGDLVPASDDVLTKARMLPLLDELLDDKRRETFHRLKDLDFAYALGDRAHIAATAHAPRRNKAARRIAPAATGSDRRARAPLRRTTATTTATARRNRRPPARSAAGPGRWPARPTPRSPPGRARPASCARSNAAAKLNAAARLNELVSNAAIPAP